MIRRFWTKRRRTLTCAGKRDPLAVLAAWDFPFQASLTMFMAGGVAESCGPRTTARDESARRPSHLTVAESSDRIQVKEQTGMVSTAPGDRPGISAARAFAMAIVGVAAAMRACTPSFFWIAKHL